MSLRYPCMLKVVGKSFIISRGEFPNLESAIKKACDHDFNACIADKIKNGFCRVKRSCNYQVTSTERYIKAQVQF